MIRRALLSMSAAALAVGLAASPSSARTASASAPSRATISGIPQDCHAEALSVSSSRYRHFVGYNFGSYFASPRLKQRSLPFQPRHVALTQSWWAGDSGGDRHLALDSAGGLHVWRQNINDYTGTGSYSMKRITGSWKGTKALTASTKYIYRVSGSALVRYEIGSGGVPVRGRVVGPAGYGSVKTLTHDYSTPQADTLIATTTGGTLRQIKVRRTTAGRTTSVTLRSSGFENFRSFTAGGCWDRSWSGTYLGVTKAGGVYVYYDADRTDSRVSFKSGRVGSWSQRTY